MSNKRRISAEEVQQVGATLGLDWQKIDLEQFRRGLEAELEHGARDPETNVTNDDLGLTGKIAWAHLKEFPDYYTRLDRLEARRTPMGRRTADAHTRLKLRPVRYDKNRGSSTKIP
ncbi:MAG TPA: DUF5661 family protein [Anaerolineae bacterium]|nr:DUF5661 family protein [Anaerolineae bacterium]